MDQLIKKYNKYTNEVVSYIDCDYDTKLRIKEDIMETLHERNNELMEEDPIKLMGEAYTVASEFGENMTVPRTVPVYKSEAELFGIPLICISRDKNVTAKGIIAYGYKSIGLISVGCASVGVVSIGALSVGIFAFGGLAVGLLSAFGGMAVAYDIAMGGFAIAKSLAVGGLAIAKDVAFGGVTCAKLMAYNQGSFNPIGLDESSAIAYRFPVYKHDFKETFDKLFQGFGTIKSFIVHILSK